MGSGKSDPRQLIGPGGKPVPQKIAEAGETKQKVAKLISSNKEYIRQAAELKEEDPEMYERVRNKDCAIHCTIYWQKHKGSLAGYPNFTLNFP